MVEPAISEIDPLGAFSYLSYNHYGQFTTNECQYTVKPEQYIPQNNVTNVPYEQNTNTQKSLQDTSNLNTNDDFKPELPSKPKKDKKNYVSEKITEEGYPFYGCAVCNISYSALRELDTHVATHKDRITSYDWKIKNQLKKKRLKKEQKRLKKVKKENLDLEIKPEDGYIGTEKATDVLNESNVDLEAKKEEEEKKKEELNLQKIYKCFACQKQFTLSYYLKLHVRSHTDEKPYTCEQCGQSFITASKLGRHNKRFHLSIQYQCRICYRRFYRFELLTRHFDNKHAEDKLEGEPYDYNAILPYLKELEEQMREKEESEKTKTEESSTIPLDIAKDEKVTDIKDDCKITIEEVKVPMEDIEIKEEIDDSYDIDNDTFVDTVTLVDNVTTCGNVTLGEDVTSCDNVTVNNVTVNDANEDTNEVTEDFRDASNNDDSDEDYFPSNTWIKAEEPLEPVPNASSSVQCNICDKQLSTASYMRVHMRTHTGERPFKCYVCGVGFITASKMHRHALTHPESLPDDVKKEGVDIKNENGDDENKEKVKKAVKKLSKKLNEKSTKYKKRPHACEYCHKRFLHLNTLQVHKKSHEGEQIKYECHFCLLELMDEEHLRMHESTHTGPKPYQCTLCDKSYKKRESMIYHRKNHKPEREFICDICTKSFNAQCKLQRHIISHSVDKYMLKYECPVCAHMFNTKYHVQMHLSTHQREGVIQEENRNEILAMVLQNARRIPRKGENHNLSDVIPSDERSRVCNICGEVFQHFYYLEEHLKSHGSKIAIENIDKEEEKKYICEVCNKAFKLHYYLKLHSFTHTKEKPFICQQCGKGFITRGKLKRHLETHTGLKKYQCHICCKFFTRPSYLRIHVRTIHGAQLVRLGLS